MLKQSLELDWTISSLDLFAKSWQDITFLPNPLINLIRQWGVTSLCYLCFEDVSYGWQRGHHFEEQTERQWFESRLMYTGVPISRFIGFTRTSRPIALCIKRLTNHILFYFTFGRDSNPRPCSCQSKTQLQSHKWGTFLRRVPKRFFIVLCLTRDSWKIDHLLKWFFGSVSINIFSSKWNCEQIGQIWTVFILKIII